MRKNFNQKRLRPIAEDFSPTAHRLTALQTRVLSVLFVLFVSVALLPSVCAQTASGSTAAKLNVGKVDIDFQHGAGIPGFWHLTGNVKLTSTDYDLNAEDIKITFNPKSGQTASTALKRAVAVGIPTRQVVAHLRRPLDSQEYTIYADQAIYVPDTTRPSGGKMDFTGHVKLITTSGFLSEPSVSTFESATVLLGAGKDYPQVSTGAGHITLTPAQ